MVGPELSRERGSLCVESGLDEDRMGFDSTLSSYGSEAKERLLSAIGGVPSFLRLLLKPTAIPIAVEALMVTERKMIKGINQPGFFGFATGVEEGSSTDAMLGRTGGAQK